MLDFEYWIFSRMFINCLSQRLILSQNTTYNVWNAESKLFYIFSFFNQSSKHSTSFETSQNLSQFSLEFFEESHFQTKKSSFSEWIATQQTSFVRDLNFLWSRFLWLLRKPNSIKSGYGNPIKIVPVSLFFRSFCLMSVTHQRRNWRKNLLV